MNPLEIEQKVKQELLDVLMREMDDFSFSEMKGGEEEAGPMAVIEETKTMPVEEAKGEIEEMIDGATEGAEMKNDDYGEMEEVDVENMEDDEEEDEDIPQGFSQFVRGRKGGY